MTLHPKEMMESLLDQHNGDILVMLNGKHEGVSGIPEDVLDEHGMVTVRVVLAEPRPVRDLEIDDHGWGGVLSFSGVEDFAVVPWQAVLAFHVTGYTIVLTHRELDLDEPTQPVRPGLSVVK